MRALSISKVIVRRKTDGKYLVLVGSKWEDRPDRSQKPDLAGGMVEPGETVEQGAVREVKEEAGLDITEQSLTLVHAETFISDRDDASINRLMFFAEVDGDQEVALSWEHESYYWVDKIDLLRLEIRDPYPEIFAYLDKVGVLV